MTLEAGPPWTGWARSRSARVASHTSTVPSRLARRNRRPSRLRSASVAAPRGPHRRGVARPSEYQAGELNVVDHGLLRQEDVTPGKLSEKAGSAARAYVVSATRAALAGEIAAIVTLPMNKEATRLSDPEFTGHTELIGALCGVQDVTIMLASDDLIVTHVSTHMSLLNAIHAAKRPRIAVGRSPRARGRFLREVRRVRG